MRKQALRKCGECGGNKQHEFGTNMINRKNRYKSESNGGTNDKKTESALPNCSRNNGSRTLGSAVLTALWKTAAFALLICIGAAAILGCSGGESLAPVKTERPAEQTDSPAPNPTQVLAGDYIPPVRTPLPLPADEPNPFETELQFNNENFARAFKYKYGAIYVSDRSSIAELHLRRCGLMYIDDLTKFGYLRVLDLSENMIYDLSPLEKLTALRKLNLDTNNISDISHLSELTELLELDIDKNNISNLYPLMPLKNMTKLLAHENEIHDLQPLSELTKLQKLGLRSNSISDLRPLSKLVELRELYLHDNSISDVSPLSELHELRRLNLHDNVLSDISELRSLENMERLWIYNNSISDISALAGMKKLSVLYAGMNSIEDISSLTELVNLTDVSLHNNAITDVSALEEHVNLKKLDLSGNPIDDSAVEVLCTLTGLEKLDLQRTGISQEGVAAIRAALPKANVLA